TFSIRLRRRVRPLKMHASVALNLRLRRWAGFNSFAEGAVFRRYAYDNSARTSLASASAVLQRPRFRRNDSAVGAVARHQRLLRHGAIAERISRRSLHDQ